MIDIVAEAFTANNIKFSKCTNRSKDFKSGGSLDRFKSDPDTRVLVMPLSLGAEGLDLIVASHVFLLEPLLNKSIEQQAVNRIHRIGQTKSTYVHKYIVQETVEQRIHDSSAVADLHITAVSSSSLSSSSVSSIGMMTQFPRSDDDGGNDSHHNPFLSPHKKSNGKTTMRTPQSLLNSAKVKSDQNGIQLTTIQKILQI
jgi:superfamily II DNA or RNA helicase